MTLSAAGSSASLEVPAYLALVLLLAIIRVYRRYRVSAAGCVQRSAVLCLAIIPNGVAMTEQNHILHFSLGPVQGFIGGARRTRDLWAGSFLLSWLTARAMAVVRAKHNGGRIVFPAVDKDPLVRSVEKSLRSLAPRIGTVPNRFKAEVPEEFEPKRCEEAVRAAWRKLADAVWDEFLPRLDERLKKLNGGLPARTKQIWEDQVRNFWEISWVKGPDDGIDGEWLEHRKTWRNHRPPDEAQGGDHCTLMGDWQEISGYVRARDRADQDTFWSEFRECEFRDSIGDRNGKKLLLDIVEGERLCAIALIKRLFPRLPRETREVFGWDPCGDGGGNWPSTGHIAAAHWIKRAHEKEKEACRAYGRHIRNTFHPIHFAGRRRSNCAGHTEALGTRPTAKHLRRPGVRGSSRAVPRRGRGVAPAAGGRRQGRQRPR